MSKPVFTVFTPTFNRENTLHRVFDSVKKQTFKNFEWVIIDDGSTDNTRKLVDKWIKQANFPIRYYFQKNHGLNYTLNKGISLARGELFLYIPSDDSFKKNALERLLYHWNSIPKEKRNTFVGVTGLCEDQNGKLVGSEFPKDIFDSNSLESKIKYNIQGEKWGFQKTEILKNYKFPVITKPIKIFVPEGIVWNKIAKKYKTRYINETLRIFYTDSEDSIQNSKIHIYGSLLYTRDSLNNYTYYFFHDPSYYVKLYLEYYSTSIKLKKITESFNLISGITKKTIFVVFLLPFLFFKQIKKTLSKFR